MFIQPFLYWCIYWGYRSPDYVMTLIDECTVLHSFGSTPLMGKYRGTWRKSVPVPLYPPKIPQPSNTVRMVFLWPNGPFNLLLVLSCIITIRQQADSCVEVRELHTSLLHCVKLLAKIHLLAAIALTPDGSSTVHICTPTIHRTIQ